MSRTWTREDLVLSAMSSGITYREAKKLVNALFGAIRDALKKGEAVELPFGTLEVIPQAVRPYRRWRHAKGDPYGGQPVGFYKRRKRVALVAQKDQAIEEF